MQFFFFFFFHDLDIMVQLLGLFLCIEGFNSWTIFTSLSLLIFNIAYLIRPGKSAQCFRIRNFGPIELKSISNLPYNENYGGD